LRLVLPGLLVIGPSGIVNVVRVSRRSGPTARRGAIVSCVGGLRELGREDVGRQDLGCCAEEVLVGHQGCDDGAVGVGVASGLVGECIEDPKGVGVGSSREPDNRSHFFVGECDSAGEQIGERVVLSIGRDDLGDEGLRK